MCNLNDVVTHGTVCLRQLLQQRVLGAAGNKHAMGALLAPEFVFRLLVAQVLSVVFVVTVGCGYFLSFAVPVNGPSKWNSKNILSSIKSHKVRGKFMNVIEDAIKHLKSDGTCGSIVHFCWPAHASCFASHRRAYGSFRG